MKKLIAMLLVMTMILSFAACAAKEETKPTETAAPETAAETEAAPETEVVPETEETAAETEAEQPAAPALEDGIYTVDVTTDSTMFHVNEALEGKGTLTVQDGAMTVHMTLAGKGYTMLFLGKGEDAEKEGAVVCEYSEDTVNYSDGTTDVAYGFDLPVPVLDQEFDVAAFGKKSAAWKDHTVMVSNPVPAAAE